MTQKEEQKPRFEDYLGIKIYRRSPKAGRTGCFRTHGRQRTLIRSLAQILKEREWEEKQINSRILPP
ncbi:hypothetical protein G7K_2937-t1 [Saitoella complicata NRRL Y-17804]|uniref:Uncharacterized protein n=1 Tax=Saitoella complicata (strain BCRC 22490 / CBS 7301 / JCM 7358 / NBRC 10748 / NRRL Y-17804) TaxID=698492 RepID=A0A0E9NG28_SAICN|nr:hypothetical protein G7K_2937-t1 [Saitoella complicata NRRL Y-17804]